MKKNGFTLVELLAVIVILAIILVIAVPKVMTVIEDSKKATLESTVKMIASAAEKKKIENEIFEENVQIDCEDVVKLNNIDYDRCVIEFDSNNNALVSIKGKGKFANLNICEGNKIVADANDTSCSITYGNAVSYIKKLEAFSDVGLVQAKATYNGTDYDAGIRYVGPLTGDNAVKNQVYFNCEDEYTDDSKTIKYGDEDYVYKEHCEVWRIIGVFDVEDGEGNKSSRIKIINTNSTFKASWDSSADGTKEGETAVNEGYGVNQWGSSGNYVGADLMNLLNGYYIGKEDSSCVYCNDYNQKICNLTCDTAEKTLKSQKMKPLTDKAKSMIDNAVWDLYGVEYPDEVLPNSSWASIAYLQEKGISTQYTGISECSRCNDGVTRTNSWIGLVGLMSVSDMVYANGWLYNQSGTTLYSWSITPRAYSYRSDYMWYAHSNHGYYSSPSSQRGVWPSVYLKSNIEIIDGDGDEMPYKLKLNSM